MDRHVAAGEVQPVVPSTTRASIIIFIELWDRPGISANGDDWVTWLIDWQGDKSDF
jgi:hypothetical protein